MYIVYSLFNKFMYFDIRESVENFLFLFVKIINVIFEFFFLEYVMFEI